MAIPAPARLDRVRLIPWDPSSEQQFQRMYDQRVACGWRHHELPEWKDKALRGIKFLYWIVLSDHLDGRDALLEEHVRVYENESKELSDTATSIGKAPRTPSHEQFLPVGHAALELDPAASKDLGLPESTPWIKSLYVSWALQEKGLGRSAMAQIERLASQPPLSASMITLDTVQRDFALREELQRALYQDQGRPPPQTARAAEDWYSRQGYSVIRTVQAAYDWTNPASGNVISLPIVYMSKAVA